MLGGVNLFLQEKLLPKEINYIIIIFNNKIFVIVSNINKAH